MGFFVRNRIKTNKFRQRHYHNRLMLLNTLIFMVVAYFFAFIASDYAIRLERIQALQQNRDALNSITRYYDRKLDEFLHLIFPLYDEPQYYDAISRLLEAKSDLEYESDAYNKLHIVSTLQGLAVRDTDIAAILIYKNLTDARFVYSAENRTLERVGSEYPFFSMMEEKGTGRSLYGTRTIAGGSGNIRVHGIAATLGSRGIRHNAGSLVITYRTRAMERILQEYSDKVQGNFVIISTQGEMIFDSHRAYGDGMFPHTDILLSEEDIVLIDGIPCYVQRIPMLNRQYIGAHIVPKSIIDETGTDLPRFIYAIFTGMIMVSAILYFLAGSLASRRVGELVEGMKRVGSNNLSYRFEIRGRSDEFEQIAVRFNDMCDELQITIDREYVSEINKKNAELNALQAGINPHFLYNTLEAIRIKAVDDGNSDIGEMIVLLANLFRSIVREDTFISIQKEINTCSMYLSIFTLRYAHNLEYELSVEPQIFEYGIPKNLLQPIIENYFIHGIREDSDNNRFLLHGIVRDDDIFFTMEDNGRGIEQARIKEINTQLHKSEVAKGSSYGLANVHDRIRLIYGEPYGIRIESIPNEKTTVIVHIRALTLDELKEAIRTNMDKM